jgi:ribosomal-protein-alanine N-acetyltransferase
VLFFLQIADNLLIITGKLNMQNSFITNRLHLTPLTLNEDEFILELVNTPGWLQFIGDRKIHNIDDAKAYIKKIADSPQFTYWVVKPKDTGLPIGVITFIKRDYLAHHDIGFAFLPAYAKMGYAFEAAAVVVNTLSTEMQLSRLLATTLASNAASIALLTKLGFSFDQEIVVENETLQVYKLEWGGGK